MTNKTIFPTGTPIVELPAECLTQLLSGARKTESDSSKDRDTVQFMHDFFSGVKLMVANENSDTVCIVIRVPSLRILTEAETDELVAFMCHCKAVSQFYWGLYADKNVAYMNINVIMNQNNRIKDE
jgi:hypothetical protein